MFAAVPRWFRLCLAATVIAGLGPPAPVLPGSALAQLAQQPSPPVPVVRPRTQSVTDFVEITGNAAAVNAVKLVARVEGYLENIHYEDGQFVNKGDLLFTIQQDQYKDQLQQAQAQVMQQQAARDFRQVKKSRRLKGRPRAVKDTPSAWA